MFDEKRYTKIGEYHEQNNQENQDVVYSKDNKDFFFFAVADGASSCEFSKKGAEFACEVVAKLVFELGDMLFDYSKEKVAYIILEEIQYGLAKKAKEMSVPIDSYASTMSFGCIDKKKKRMMLFNIGDSAAIITENNGDKVNVESKTDANENTFITTPSAYKKAKVVFFNQEQMKDMDTVLLCSDGTLKNIIENGSISKKAGRAIASGDYGELDRIIESGEKNDDRSYISVNMERF